MKQEFRQTRKEGYLDKLGIVGREAILILCILTDYLMNTTLHCVGSLP